MVRRWRRRLECIFESDADPCAEALTARALEARDRHRQITENFKARICAGELDFAEAARLLTAEADLNLQAMLSIAADQLAQDHGPAPGRYAIFGLGKFGGAEMTLGSDLDLLFVFEPTDAEAEVRAQDYFGRLAMRLTHLLVSAPDWRAACEVDFRLRPHGVDGPLATPLSALSHYLRKEAWVWELQALTRLRAVAGCEQLAKAVEHLARQTIVERCRTIDTDAEVAAMRALLDLERPPRHEWDLKNRPGGLVDIEFIAQALQLASARDGAPILAANTGEALDRLAQGGRLAPALARQLKATWGLLSALRQLQSAFGVADLGRLKGVERAALEAMTALKCRGVRGRLETGCPRTRGLFEAIVQPLQDRAAA